MSGHRPTVPITWTVIAYVDIGIRRRHSRTILANQQVRYN